jgi:hypothetical protein
MTNAFVNGDHMPRRKLDSAIIKINEEAAFQCQKTFIGVGMTVPMISLSHGADAHFMIVDFIDLTLNNAMTSAKKGGALIAGCSPAVSLAKFGYH